MSFSKVSFGRTRLLKERSGLRDAELGAAALTAGQDLELEHALAELGQLTERIFQPPVVPPTRNCSTPSESSGPPQRRHASAGGGGGRVIVRSPWP